MKGPIQSVEVEYFVHATEDEARVKEAVSAALAIGEPGEEEALQGHFGNRILSVRHHLTGDGAQSVVDALASRMEPGLKQELERRLPEHLDEHSALYVRLDKQLIMERRLGLAESDGVRLRVKPRLYVVRGGAAALFAGELKLDAR